MPLDIGIGLILGVIFSHVFHIYYPTVLSLGVTAMLLPDLDYVWRLIRSRALPTSEHRDLFHYPILFIPIVGLLGSLISVPIGLLFMSGALLHFIHDSIGVGFGIKWLRPFRQNSYLFFFQTRTTRNLDMPKQRFYSWNDAERKEMIRQYADPGWIRHIYLRPHPFGYLNIRYLLSV